VSIAAARVTVTTSATALDAPDPGSGSYDVLVRNRGTASVDLGGSDVTTGAGFELAAGDVLTFQGNEILYAVAASGTVRVDVLRAGVG
jgi:hypothetical protein